MNPDRSDRLRPRLLGELAIVLLLFVGYDRVADFADADPIGARDRGRALLLLEHWLHLDVERSLDLLVAPHLLLGKVLAVDYDLAHGLVTLTVLGALLLLRPAHYGRARNAWLAVNAAALAVFALLPVAPPRLLPGFVDVVARSGTWGAWATSSSGVARHAAQLASMPSLHVAWATWVVLAVRAATARPALRRLAAAHLATTCAVVVVTGNHYVLDLVAGAALAGLAWRATAVQEPVVRGEVLVVSASMGAGHDGVAYELARRLREQGTQVQVLDYLHFLPARVGAVIKAVYGVQLRRAPRTYDWLYGALERHVVLDRVAGTIAGWASGRLRRHVRRGGYGVVLATYPLAGRALGRLRRSGRLDVPCATFLTDVDVHTTWLDRGTDLYLTAYETSAEEVLRRTGTPAVATGPVLPPAHTPPVAPAERARARAGLGLAPDERAVLLVTGSWGVGAVRSAALRLQAEQLSPIVLCGRNEQLRSELAAAGVRAVGWTTDVRSYYAAADLVVHNAGGLSSLEAIGAGVPVLGHACLPGHGWRNARAMAEAGLAALAEDEDDLVRHVRRLAGTAEGAAQAAGARRPYALDPLEVLRSLAARPARVRVARRRVRRGAALVSLVALTTGLTDWGVSAATERGVGVVRPARGAVYLGVAVDGRALSDPATAQLLSRAGAAAVVTARDAHAHPDGLTRLQRASVGAVVRMPRLPREPGDARDACAAAVREVMADDAVAPSGVVTLGRLGPWPLLAAHSAHVRAGVATPLRSARVDLLRGGQLVVVDVGPDQVQAVLWAVAARAATQHLQVVPLTAAWGS